MAGKTVPILGGGVGTMAQLAKWTIEADKVITFLSGNGQ